MLFFLNLVLTGLFAGFVGSIIGIGGGTLMVPILTLLLDVPIHNAIGTSIIAIMATSISAQRRYVVKRLTNIRLGLSLETFTAAGGIAGALTASYLQSSILMGVFGAFVLAVSYILYIKNKKSRPEGRKAASRSVFSSSFYDYQSRGNISYNVKNIPAGLGASFFAGIASGLLGIGGGAVKVPNLNIIMGLPIKAASATSNYMIGITAAASSIIYYAQGYINPFITSAVVLGVLGGGTLGSFFASKVRSMGIVKIMIGVFILIGINMILRAFGIDIY